MMKTFVALALLCISTANAMHDTYMYNGCPVHLLSQLSSIVSSLYGYGQSSSLYGSSMFSPLSSGYMSATPYSAGGTPYSAGGLSGYQATAATNPYNPTCPWPLINGVIQQIQQYVNQMQASQQGTPAANTLTGYSVTPFSRFGATPFAAQGGMFGPFRRK